ncbi:lysophospholipid acyltransferase family protein [Shouchella shacheensis]|uniref:lysophospholipid acyltransferase family protein n=1 Tax=Shouchella shacheensis TaxID=1649580 RepID=UPI00073FAAC6|nr:lysophospholipid acyltransferase family protein [Shouchella shacheensis]
MIYANKNRTYERLFQLYNTYWLFKRSFSYIHVRGEAPAAGQPVLVLSNHSNWWDGLSAFYLSRNAFCMHDCYMMTGEEGLQSFRFFHRLGAFSIDTKRSLSMAKSLRYAKGLLKERKAIWMFPQGEERHLEQRPLHLASGAAYLAEEVQESTIVPVTFYYTFLHEQRPRLFVDIGTSLQASDLCGDRSEKTKQLQEVLTKQLDAQRACVMEETMDEYRVTLRGTKSVSDWFSFFRKGGAQDD